MDKGIWFSEVHKGQQAFSMKVAKVLYQQKSRYQDILVFENEHYGKVLVLDGYYMLSDLDEHMYHKALTKYGMQNLNPDKQNLKILLVGAGDGGIARDLLKNYDEKIMEITLVEIDKDVIEVSKRFFPLIAQTLDHPKLKIVYEDAINFVNNFSEKFFFDLILCDSTDPVGFAEGLIEKDFYWNLKKIMDKDAIFCAQSGSPFFQINELNKARSNLEKVFKEVHTYFAPMIIYPGSIWSYTAAGEKIVNRNNIDIGEMVPYAKTKNINCYT